MKKYMIALMMLAHTIYGAVATITTGDSINIVATAGAGAIADDAPFEERAAAALSREPYKSRHASDCMVMNLKLESMTADGTIPVTAIGTGTLMQTREGHLFILTAAHVLKKDHVRQVIFSNGSRHLVTESMLPASGMLGIEDGFLRHRGYSPLSIITKDGKAVHYNPPYFAWEGTTVIREDGSEEFVPGLNSLSGDAYEERKSLIRDYAVLILEDYPTGITPAKFASAEIKPELLTIPVDDAPRERILCSLSGYGGLVIPGTIFFTAVPPSIKKPNPSFRLLPMEVCTTQIPVSIAATTDGMKLSDIGALIEPYGTLNPFSNPKKQIICRVTGSPKHTTCKPLLVEKVGLAVPTLEGFSGSSLRADTTGEVIGIASCKIPLGIVFKSDEKIMYHLFHHNLIPEIGKIHTIVDAHYAAKEAHAEAEELKSKPYAVTATNYSLWAF